MSIAIGFIVFILNLSVTSAQHIHRHYSGAVSRDGSIQLVDIFVEQNTLRYSLPALGLFEVLSEPIESVGDTFIIHLYYGKFLCLINPTNGEITGTSDKWNPKLRIHLIPSMPKGKKFIIEEISFFNNHINLSGELFKPLKTTGKIPYVVLIHGSDYQDRNTPYYHSLGYALAQEGIGVLLYDKRGCGRSSGIYQQATFRDLADDALTAINYLKSRTDLNINKIGVLGTSQGGWLATLVSKLTAECAFVVMNVGPAVSLFTQDLHRIKYTMLEDSWPSSAIDSAVAYTQLYFEYVLSQHPNDWAKLKTHIDQVKNAAWSEYLNLPTGPEDEDITWWRKNAFDPNDYLKTISCPVLSIFGEKDVLVPPQENAGIMDSLLNLSGVKHEVIIIKGTAHDMLTYSGLNGTNWAWPRVYWQWRKQPQEFLNSIITWIKNNHANH